VRRLLIITLIAACHAAEAPPPPGEPIRLVFRHMRMLGDPAVLEGVFRRFEALHPGVVVASEPLPNDSDLQHQLFVTNLEGGASDFDVMTLDIIWVPEFARAGWLLDLSAALPPDRVRAEFLPGPARAVTDEHATWALPWFADVGLLYWRTDLLAKYARPPPSSWRELAETTRFILEQEHDPTLRGFVWQGREYEGLICVALEVIRGFGGLRPGQDVAQSLTDPLTIEALSYLRGLIASGLSPQQTTSADEEVARTLFNEGHAVLMRNWPYAWSLLEREGSPVRGKVAFGALPAEPGGVRGGTLGGWQIGVSRHVPAWKRDLAVAFAAYLTSAEVQPVLAHAYALQPARRAPYSDPAYLATEPIAVQLGPLLAQAQPRPITPYYVMMSHELQSEFSAVVAGIRPPREAMTRAQRAVRLATGELH
jgi:multiple sugar transport system substrate-binding protein